MSHSSFATEGTGSSCCVVVYVTVSITSGGNRFGVVSSNILVNFFTSILLPRL